MNIIVTGASKGIGKAIAEKYAVEGNTLLICSRGEKSLYDTVNELQTAYPNSIIKGMSCDMANKEEVLVFAEWCLKFGSPDILINNAGQFIPGSIHDEAEGILEQMIQTNLYSAYHLTRALLPAMIQKSAGHIFNICANGGSYSISKFALLGFSKNLREELKPKGIKVTSVMPGATLSASWDGFDIDPNRIMEVNDVSEMIFAASKLSSMAVVEDIVMRPQLGDL
jgi:short-subunit dehydrogenase